MQKQIEADGYVQSYAPIVVLTTPDNRPREEVLADDTAKYRVIDGNHRVAALLRIDQENNATTPTAIDVRIHQPMGSSTERMVAAGQLVWIVSP